ncbi:hypothetical protein [Streptomyces sp. NPDC001068]|uniref:hypothetical protein n=1 Tax=Streptomyces sp. NPDC001068 TaxID=3364544 RepID=UPI0036C38672
MRTASPAEAATGPAALPRSPAPRDPSPGQGEAHALIEECRIARAHGEPDARTVAPPADALAEVSRPGSDGS